MRPRILSHLCLVSTCVSVLLAAADVRAQAIHSPAPPSPVSRTISVNGEAVAYVVPDLALVHFGVETYDPALRIATEGNDSSRTRLLKALRGAGLAERDIQADHESVEIVYPTGGIGHGISGYRVRRAYTVTVRDVPRLDEILRLVLQSGANHVDGYELRTSELRKHRDEVRKLAIRAAREKAEALAGELGCAVGLPTSIGEGYYGWFGTGSGRSGSWGSFGGDPQTQNSMVTVSGGGEEPTGAPVGQIGVRAQVSVIFEIAAR